jgi:hypothetical protein
MSHELQRVQTQHESSVWTPDVDVDLPNPGLAGRAVLGEYVRAFDVFHHPAINNGQLYAQCERERRALGSERPSENLPSKVVAPLPVSFARFEASIFES